MSKEGRERGKEGGRDMTVEALHFTTNVYDLHLTFELLE